MTERELTDSQYARIVLGMLESCVKQRIRTDDVVPLTAVLLGHDEAILVVSDGTHPSLETFLADVEATCAYLVHARAVGLLVEFFIRPVDSGDPFDQGRYNTPDLEFDPQVRTGWGALIHTASSNAEPAAHSWILSVADDGARIVSKLSDAETYLPTSVISGVVSLIHEDDEDGFLALSADDRGMLFDFVSPALPAIGLTAERVVRPAT